ncbi:hypothetical protein BH11PSE6_BH11PSE6_26870 [soil metagenome]
MDEGAMGGESVQRPKSIVMFERCYLAAFAISLVSTVLLWSSLNEQFGAQELLLGGWFLPTVTVIGFAIPLLLWYFIALRGSDVAKWIATALVALGVAGTIFSLALGRYTPNAAGLLGLVRVALQIVAIWFLFRPDTRVWFGGKPQATV